MVSTPGWDLVAWAGFQQSKLADRPPVRVEIPNHPIQIDTSRRQPQIGGGIIVEVDSPQIYLFGQDWNIRYFSASE